MLCMHVEYRSRCRVDGMHQNIVVAWCIKANVRAEGQSRCREMGKSGVAALCHGGSASESR